MTPDETDPDGGPIRRLSETTRAFAEATSDYERLLQVISRRMAELFGDACTVMLVSGDGRWLRPVAMFSPDARLADRIERTLRGPPIDIEGDSMGARVVRLGRRERMDRAEPGTSAGPLWPEYSEMASRAAPRSLITFPLRSHDRVIGTLALMRLHEQSQPFTAAEEDMAAHLVEHAALAIANALLLQSVQKELDERRAAEEQAVQFVALIQHSSDFVAMASLDGKVRFINRAGRAMLGLAADLDVTALSLTEFHTDAGMERREVLSRHGRWSGEGVLRHFQTKELIPTLVNSFLVRSATGEPAAFATVQRDNREAKQAEKRMRQMETLSAMGHLVAGVAHEVRNPLFGMMATLDAMGATQKLTDAQQPFVDALRRELQRLNLLMNDLLAYGRPLEDALVATQIQPIIDEAVQASAPLAGKQSVRLEETIQPGLPPVQASASRMAQVFQNLLDNAIHHSAAGSVVRVAAGSVVDGEKTFVETVVSDSGPGFHPSDLLHAFEPFFTRRRGGTGLGLSIVQRIVMQHGGDVRVENGPAGGAQVTIRLPAA